MGQQYLSHPSGQKKIQTNRVSRLGAIEGSIFQNCPIS